MALPSNGFISSTSFTDVDANFSRVAKYWYPVVNVKDFGATGDGTTDDTTAIQAAIDEIEAYTQPDQHVGAGLFFPPGDYRVTTTLTFDQMTGLIISGSGARHSQAAGWDAKHTGTRIIADFGGSSIPVLEFTDCSMITMEQLTIKGNVANSAANAAASCVQLNSGLGAGSAQWRLLGCVFEYAENLFRCGGGGAQELQDGNLEFSTCLFRFAGNAGLQTNHQQSVNHMCNACVFLETPRAFDFEGGAVSALNTRIYNVGVVMYVRAAGKNVGWNVFDGLRIDNDPTWAASNLTTLYQDDAAKASGFSGTSFNGVQVHGLQTTSGTRFILGKNSHVKVRDAIGLMTSTEDPPGVTVWKHELFSIAGTSSSLLSTFYGENLHNLPSTGTALDSGEIVGSVSNGKYLLLDCVSADNGFLDQLPPP